MIEHKYGSFQQKQFDEYKIRLHSKIHQLLLQKDLKVKNKYVTEESFDTFFNVTMKEIDGLNELLFHPKELVEIMSILEAAYMETQKKNFDFVTYRRLILDAHNLVDWIGGDRK